jgi:hypothetical protein
MVTNQRLIAWFLTALPLGTSIVTTTWAGTEDRLYRFGDDPQEAPTIGGTPNSPGIGSGALTLDSKFFDTTLFTDAIDLSFAGGPTYFDADTGPLARPGATGPNSFGLQFNGTSDMLFRLAVGTDANATPGSLGVPAQGDNAWTPGANGAPGYANITTRYIDGWVRPTGGAGTRRDIINDSARFAIFIGADNNWGFLNGTTTVATSTPATLNQWAHVMHRTFGAGGGAVLLVNGIAVAATPNGYATGNQAGSALDLVIGAGLNQSSNFFQGQLDDFVLGVSGNNAGQPGGRNYGTLDLATDNAFIRQNLAGVSAGDINRDGSVNSSDVNVFVPNWRRSQQVNGVTVGDLNSRLFGDLNMNGTVDIDDAYTLHFALRSAGVAAGLDFSLFGVSVPEPGSLAIVAVGMAAIGVARRRRRLFIVH